MKPITVELGINRVMVRGVKPSSQVIVTLKRSESVEKMEIDIAVKNVGHDR